MRILYSQNCTVRGKEEVEQLLCFKTYIYLVCQISQLLTSLWTPRGWMEECHDQFHKTHNLSERQAMMFWEMVCISAELWLMGQELISAHAKGSNNTDPDTKIYPTTGGTKSSESDSYKMKLQFCIDKDSKKPFFRPFRKPNSISTALTAELCTGPFQAERTLNLKARNSSKSQTY